MALDLGKVATARAWIAEAKAIAVLTGAGISAESGIPTFRGAGGLWKNFRPEELATPEAFARDPKLVWEWYEWRRGLIAAAEPNDGHRALVTLERTQPNFTLITQNVDGLHNRAGSRRVLKIHGDIWISRCPACDYQRTGECEQACPDCGQLMRPGVVWFGEPLPRIVWAAAERAVEQADVLLVAGTSAQVYPAAGLLSRAKRVIEVNTDETHVGLSLHGPCGEVLPLLAR